MKDSIGALWRGSVIGIVPGTGSGTASWIAYNEARRASKSPEKFGTGHAPGIAATESANNAVCAAALIPLLALGVPGDVVTAVLMGGLMIQGLAPGPLLFQNEPGVIVGIFGGAFMATFFMLVFGLMIIPFAAKILLVPRRLLTMSIILFCFIGAFSLNLNPVDLYTMIGFGVLGWAMQKFGFSQAALCIALILGPLMESNLRRGLIQNNDSFAAFLTRPITLLFLVLAAFSLFWPLIRQHLSRRRAATH